MYLFCAPSIIQKGGKKRKFKVLTPNLLKRNSFFLNPDELNKGGLRAPKPKEGVFLLWYIMCLTHFIGMNNNFVFDLWLEITYPKIYDNYMSIVAKNYGRKYTIINSQNIYKLSCRHLHNTERGNSMVFWGYKRNNMMLPSGKMKSYFRNTRVKMLLPVIKNYLSIELLVGKSTSCRYIRISITELMSWEFILFTLKSQKTGLILKFLSQDKLYQIALDKI